jgi:DNA primase
VRFDERFLEEIKTRVRLSDVIGRSVRLKRQGREFVGLSPFNNEKSPSFFVNDDKGFWHDFSSGKHGDLISFLQETERLSFPEAVEKLAAEAGVPMPVQDARSAEMEQKRQGLGDWLELAAKWFKAQLRRPAGAEARAYLAKRGLPEEDWDRFGLGFAPESRSALKDALVQRGAKPGDLVEAGLLIAPEGGGSPYDRFRNRLIFPIADARGRVISFGGRALNPEDRAKYLNGPESPLFHKGRTLYGLPEARKLVASGGEGAALVVGEGYMDAIAVQRAGVAAVAPLGTALTEEQMEVLWRLHPEPTLCFDGDAAGRRAASSAIDRALPLLKPGRSFKFVALEGAKDPDDLLREQGAPALRAALSVTRPFVEVLFEREREREPLDTPERRAGFKRRLRDAASLIADRDLAEAYRRDLLDRYDAVAAPAGDRGSRGGGGAPFQPRPWRKGAPPPLQPPTEEGRSAARRLARALEAVPAALAQAALDDPARVDPHLETLERDGFGDPALDPLASEIVRLRLSAETLDSDSLRRHLAARGYAALLGETARAARKSGAPFLDPELPLQTARAQWSQAYEVMARMAALESALSSAKSELGAGAGDASGFMRLKAERDALRRAIRTGTVWADGASLTIDASGAA